MSKGLVLYKRANPDKQFLYVLAEFNTETEEHKELSTSKDLDSIMSSIPQLEKMLDCDGGVVIDLSTPIE